MTAITNDKLITDPISKTMCLVQLTRIGDVLQTYQAAAQFKKLHPQYRLILVARKKFAQGASFLLETAFDKIHYLDYEALVDQCNTKDAQLVNLQQFIEQINSELISVTINLSFSKSSSFLCSLISSQYHLGMTADTHGQTLIPDKWSQYIYSNVMGGPLSSFSLVDIFRAILGENNLSENLTTTFDDKKEIKTIVIHPFASLSKKMWKSEKWIEVIYKTLKDHPQINIKIVGAKEESEKASEICNHILLLGLKKRIKNLCGKTSLKNLYDEIKTSQLFIGHDSMVGHLAAIAGVRTLTLALGTVRPIETTPYGNNNIVIAPRTKCFPCFPNDKCSFFQCHVDVPYQVVNGTVSLLIDKQEITLTNITNETSRYLLNNVDLFITKQSFKTGLQLLPLTQNNYHAKDLFRTFYKVLWSFYLKDIEFTSSIPLVNEATFKLLVVQNKGLEHLYELTEFGKSYSEYILKEIASASPNLEKIKEYSSKIEDIDQLGQHIKMNFSLLAPLIDYFTVVRGNLKGSNIVELTESSYLAYEESASLAKALYELIEMTLMENRPKINNTKQTSKQPR